MKCLKTILVCSVISGLAVAVPTCLRFGFHRTEAEQANQVHLSSDLQTDGVEEEQDGTGGLQADGETPLDAQDAIPEKDNQADSTNATIVKVTDGDTFDARLDDSGVFRIRMLGVDTPEVVDPRKPVQCFGEDASSFSKSILAVGRRIRLESDPQADERDTYGRLLRNVYLQDGTDYNAYLIENGYARSYTYFPLTPERKVQMIRLEREAKQARIGMWGACDTSE